MNDVRLSLHLPFFSPLAGKADYTSITVVIVKGEAQQSHLFFFIPNLSQDINYLINNSFLWTSLCRRLPLQG